MSQAGLFVARVAPPPLAAFVRAMHYHEADPRALPFRRLPSPFAVLVVQLGEPCLWRPAGATDWRPSPRIAIHCPTTRWSEALEPRDQPGCYVMALLEPWAPAPLFGNSLACGQVVDVEPLLPAWSRRLSTSISRAGSADARLEALEDALLSLRRRSDLPRPEVSHFLAAARASAGSLKVAEGGAGLGARQLRRRFREQTGLGLKAWCRIERFAARLRTLHPAPWSEPPAIPVDFYDQAHEIREFQRMAGITPASYRREKAAGDRRVFAFG